MHRLILLRHAKTERTAPSGQDRDRRLNERGELDAAKVGAWLVANGYEADHALVSTAVRARQTWNLIAGFMPNCRVELLDELYNADPRQLLETIRSVSTDDPARLLVIAHNPGLHELAWSLIGAGDRAGQQALAENLPTSAAVVIDFPHPDWGLVMPRSGTLKMFITPKRLKEKSSAGGH